MNYWQRQRKNSEWSGGYVEWIEDKTAFISVVFSWQMQRAHQRAVWLGLQGYHVRAGGPAVALNPHILENVAEMGGKLDALRRHNPHATFTTRGCPNHCRFCAVPKLEGDLVELNNWEPRPIVCDNNLLAASRSHFDRVIDRLKMVSQVDFNQGLDSRLLTKHHASRLAEMDLAAVRLAWDDVHLESQFLYAFEQLRAAGIPKRLIRVYVLIGYEDMPDDALYRMETIRQLGVTPNPMRYQPLNSERRNQYVAPGWTNRELSRFVRYWSNLNRVGGIPFADFDNKWRCRPDSRLKAR